jgi:hypothetical protein
MTVLARIVPDGAIAEDTLGTDMALLTYADGTVRFQHRCDRGDRGVIVCAPAIQIGSGHTLTRVTVDGPANVRPSISCPDCGTHGFVTNGVWEAC